MAARATSLSLAVVGIGSIFSYIILAPPYNSVAFGLGAGLLAVAAFTSRKRLLKGLAGERGVLPGVPSGKVGPNLGKHSREREKQHLLRRFDSVFAQLTSGDSAGRAQALEALRPILFDMSSDIAAWSGDTRLRMHYLVKEIAKDIDNPDTQRQSMGILVLVLSKGGEDAVLMARPLVFEKVKGLYRNPLFKNERLLPRVLLMLEQYDQSMAKSLVKDAIHSWDDEQFNAAKGYLGFEELGDAALHNQLGGLLNSELVRADIDSDVRAKNRAMELLNQQLTLPAVTVARRKAQRRTAQYAGSALAVSLVIILAVFASMPVAPALSSHSGQSGGPGGSGVLSVFLTDGPSPNANLRYLLVNVSSVEMGVQGGPGLGTSSYILAVPHDVGENVNLSSLNGQSLALGGVVMPSGNVTSTSIDLTGATAVYDDGSTQQLQMVGDGNLMVPILFGVAPSGYTNLTIDVTPSLGQIQQGATLSPAIHATALEEIPNGGTTSTVTVTQTATAPAVTATTTQSVTFLRTVTASLAPTIASSQTVTTTLTSPTTIVENSTVTSILTSPTTTTATVTTTTGIVVTQTQIDDYVTTTTLAPTTTTQTVTSTVPTTTTVTTSGGDKTVTSTTTTTVGPSTTATTSGGKTQTVTVTSTATSTQTATVTTTKTQTTTNTQTQTQTVTTTRTRGAASPTPASSLPPTASAGANAAAGLVPLMIMGALLTMGAIALLALPKAFPRLSEGIPAGNPAKTFSSGSNLP